jgi:hypothetical protein
MTMRTCTADRSGSALARTISLQSLAALAMLVPVKAYSFEPDSVVYIQCAGPDGKLSRGSGVIVSDRGRVLTAKHVAPAGYECSGVLGTAAEVPTRRLLRRKASPDYDAILLEFIPKPNEEFRPVSFVQLEPNMQGEPIAAYGFPASGTGQVSIRSGTISTTIPNEQGTIETDALTTRGMSGGPVFLREGDGLVGIVAGANFDPGTGWPTDFAVLAAELVADDFDLEQTSGLPDETTRSASEPGSAVAPPRSGDLQALVGDWSGEAVEPGGFRFQVELQVLPACALNAFCGTIAVPHVPCHGRLTLIGEQENGYEFNVDRFDRLSDVSVCTPGAGEVIAPLADGTLSYFATYSGAQGVLRRKP